MKSKGISQETLKLIACVTMLADHAAAALVQDYEWMLFLRGIGRMAFPIYCFLLAEGAHYTHSPGKYALRLAVGALLAEIPFDYALFGDFTWYFQSVMLTLLLGYGALWCMGRCEKNLLQLLVAIPFVLMGDLLSTDYGSLGVLMIVLLGFTRNLPGGRWLQMAVIILIAALLPSITIPVLGIPVSLELAAVFSLIPIGFYHGSKRTRSKALQWAFYLFYPVHLALIWVISLVL